MFNNDGSRSAHAASWLYLAIVLLFIATSFFLSLFLSQEALETHWYLVTPLLHLVCFLIPALVFAVARKKQWRWARMKVNTGLLIVIPLAIANFFVVTSLSWFWRLLLIRLGEQTASQTVPLPETMMQLLFSLLVVGVMPAITEEFVFRGNILPGYEPTGKVRAAVLSGILFGLLHGSPDGLLGHIYLGITLGLVVLVTDSLLAGALYHCIHNSLSMGIGYIVLRANGGIEVSDSAAQLQHLLDSPGTLMISNIVIAILLLFSLAVAVGLFIALYYYNRNRAIARGEDGRLLYTPRVPENKLSLLSLWPLVPALVVVFARYVLAWIEQTIV